MTVLSHDDAHQLFAQTIVEHEDVLGIVKEVAEAEDESGPRLFFRPFTNRSNIIISANPDEVFCPTFPNRLGYVMYEPGVTSFLRRRPRRQYRVGWCEGNVEGLNLLGTQRLGSTFLGYLRGVYLSLEEAIKMSKETKGTVPFDHQFAISHSGAYLAFKGRDVAYMKENRVDWGKTNGLEAIRKIFELTMEKKNASI